MDIGQHQLEKARIYAYWGFSGLVVPVIGIIACSISISILERLVVDEEDAETVEEYERVAKLATGARILSIIMLLITVAVVIFLISSYAEVLNEAASARGLY